mmetsp:Transcript_27664/g.42615  ORF Transcript_27664/g.42615 Transcript_27664/m.42615 type:complete len:131 (-) Transcript_27664:283-675(-)|eukprot:CAMPEP_0117027026 /NCGR_PEP_ID=MMETSP0472-20121206/19807_1 /TAXON_ID=693140 ORGANISM="Tiarina fusus, Strain LIS" /NCGR_SAMPLE_ID=MMETSP0472 /ASSEMBLY_ACC=CAM_ASM_000603 /LENGTH=130 /DNA_ID=CAMNT_0004734185 /DNA_START=221 /DNA_END=613 /DNA_ORIENTATION=+
MTAHEYSEMAVEVNRFMLENLYISGNPTANAQQEPKSPTWRKYSGVGKDTSPTSVLDRGVAPIVPETREFDHDMPQPPDSPEAGFEFELIETFTTPPQLHRRTIDPPTSHLSPRRQRPLDPVARFLSSQP